MYKTDAYLSGLTFGILLLHRWLRLFDNINMFDLVVGRMRCVIRGFGDSVRLKRHGRLRLDRNARLFSPNGRLPGQGASVGCGFRAVGLNNPAGRHSARL